MLQSIRDSSQGIVAKIIVGLIIVTFSLFGVESLVSLTADSNSPATVNGQEISEQELYQATQIQRRQLLSQMGENVDPALLDENVISGMVLEGLIEQKAMLISAEEKGLYVSDRMLDQMIVATPDFQVDGVFNSDEFQAVLRNSGLTPLMYRDLLRKERLLGQESTAYQLSSFVVPTQIQQIVSLETQTRTGGFYVLPLDVEQSVSLVTDNEISSRYEQERESLTTTEQVTIEYLVLDKNDLRNNITVSEEDLRAEYQQRLASFTPEEQRHVAHILVEISSEQNDEAALAKAAALKAQIAEGASFEELAKAESDDIGSAPSGGDLGNVTTGMLSQPFDDAMVALQEGEVSEPVRTEFGYHLIKLISATKTSVPTFEELRSTLEDSIVSQKVEAEYVVALEQLADTTFSSADLLEPSDVLGLAIQESTPFDRSGGSDAITENTKVISAAFNDEQLKDGLNSAPIEIDRDRTVVLRVKEHFEPRVQSLDEVKERLKASIAYDKALEALNASVDKQLAALDSGESIASVAGTSEVVELKAANRSASNAPEAVIRELFALPHPGDKPVNGKIELNNGGIAVVQLSAVGQSQSAENADTINAMGQYLASMQGQSAYRMVSESVKTNSVIERK